MSLKKLNTKEQEITDEIKQRDDIVHVISLLNNFHNFQQFQEDGVDLEKVLPHLCKEAIERGERIETKGYLDLIPIIEELK